MRLSARSATRTPLGVGVAPCMVVGSLVAADVPGDRAGVRTVGLGGMVDLPAADSAPDDAQSWTGETARAGRTVPSTGSLSRRLWPDQVHARPPAWSPGAAHRIQVMGVMRVAYLVNQ